MKGFNTFACCYGCRDRENENDTMPKRSFDDSELMELVVPNKKIRGEEGTYSSTQKSAIAEFTSVTQSDKNSAGKLLKQHNWNVSAAVNAYFSNPANNAANPIRASMNKIFDKYRDDPKNEPDEINVEGTGKLLGEMGVDLEDIGSLVFSELVSSPSLGKVTREGFVDGATEAHAESIAKLRTIVQQRKSALPHDKELFRNVYNHTFGLALQSGQKSLTPDIALEFWKVLFGSSGYEWRSSRTPWLDWWFQFLEEKWKKAVNKDLWRHTLTFAEETLKDDTLGFWTEESSWPSVIDDFVEWVKTEKRPTNGDAMEVE